MLNIDHAGNQKSEWKAPELDMSFTQNTEGGAGEMDESQHGANNQLHTDS